MSDSRKSGRSTPRASEEARGTESIKGYQPRKPVSLDAAIPPSGEAGQSAVAPPPAQTQPKPPPTPPPKKDG